MPQLNIRLTKEQLNIVRAIVKTYRTSTSHLFRGYVEYLEKGGVPIGYPQDVQVSPVPDKGTESETE